MNRNFSADGPDQLWVADITQVSTWNGWLYLAVLLDCLGAAAFFVWSMTPHMRAELVEGALAMAISNRTPKTAGGAITRIKAHSIHRWPSGILLPQ